MKLEIRWTFCHHPADPEKLEVKESYKRDLTNCLNQHRKDVGFCGGCYGVPVPQSVNGLRKPIVALDFSLPSYQFERFEVKPDVAADRAKFADQLDVGLVLLHVEIKSHQGPIRVSGNLLAELVPGNP